jgi:hypothetical protein
MQYLSTYKDLKSSCPIASMLLGKKFKSNKPKGCRLMEKKPLVMALNNLIE